MNIWEAPYRICVVNQDENLVKVVTNILENNKQWELVVVNTLWEAAFLMLSGGLHVVVVTDNDDKPDMTIKTFSESRFFSSKKLPSPYMFIKLTREVEEQKLSNFPLCKKFKQLGIINSLRTELVNVAAEFQKKDSVWSTLSVLQFSTFVLDKWEEPGAILKNNLSDYCFIMPKSTILYKDKKYNELKLFLLDEIKKNPYLTFTHYELAKYFYSQNLLVHAREELDRFINKELSSPILLFYAFLLATSFNDTNYQYALLKTLEESFETTNLARFAFAIWNCRMDHPDIGISQLFYCLEQMPKNLLLAEELLYNLKKYNQKSLIESVRSYCLSSMLNTKMHRYLFSSLYN